MIQRTGTGLLCAWCALPHQAVAACSRRQERRLVHGCRRGDLLHEIKVNHDYDVDHQDDGDDAHLHHGKDYHGDNIKLPTSELATSSQS